MTNIVGPDVSFYQDDPETSRQIDFEKMKSASEFVIIRAGQNLWPDPDFAYNWQHSKEAGLPRGSYWFYDSRVMPSIQANLWLEQLGNDLGELPLFADFEESYGGPYAGWQNFKAFLEHLKSKVNGHEIFIYTAYYYWRDHVPAAEREYFHQYPLWIANYGALAPLVPEPWVSDEWLFWQYTETGDGAIYGVESKGIDLNYFNGDLQAFRSRFNLPEQPPPPVVNDEIVQTHKGVTLHIIKRFGANCWVNVVDPFEKSTRIEISDCGFAKPSTAQNIYKCQVVSNGGGWPNVQDQNHRSNEMWVSNGRFMQNPSFIKDNRPYIDVAQTGMIRVSPNAKVMSNPYLYNSVGWDRMLVIDGKFNEAISDRVTKDARTASGVTDDGKFVLLSVEGNDVYQRGLTFQEMAQVLIEFGVVNGGNNDGGSSSTIINTAISPSPLFVGSDGAEAPVINHIMIFSEQIGGPIEPPEETMDATYRIDETNKERLTPSMFEVNSRTGATAGSTVIALDAITYQDPKTDAIFIKNKATGWYQPIFYQGKSLATLISGPTEPPPTETPVHWNMDFNSETEQATVTIDGQVWTGKLSKQ